MPIPAWLNHGIIRPLLTSIGFSPAAIAPGFVSIAIKRSAPSPFGKTHLADAEIPAHREISRVRKNGRIERKAKGLSHVKACEESQKTFLSGFEHNAIGLALTVHSLVRGFIF